MLCSFSDKKLSKLRHSGAGDSRNRHHGRMRELRALYQCGHLLLDFANPSDVDAIGLRDDCRTAIHVQQVENVQVRQLSAAMTPSSAANDEQREIDAAYAGQHVRMKRSWPGTSTNPISLPSGSGRYAKPRSNRNAARFLYRADGRCRRPVNVFTSNVLP
jgi:hypothetical protein